ncbi:MAG TPA: 3-keto-5-aminohexanoate cleavage protein [Gemmatimonadales bacterium]|nr:3-keto-5-aminohexanoate cleavage protein [Gemmatimonadales bacterium]
MSSGPGLLQAALNGGRRRDDYPTVPWTPEDLARSAADAVAAGAAAIHVHVRDARGVETLEPADIARTVSALRTAVARVPVGVSTGAWIVSNTERRHHLVECWTELPDYASVNFDEPGAELLAELLLRRAIGIEAGVANTIAATRFARSGLAARCLRILLEPMTQDLTAALDVVRDVEGVLDEARIGIPRLLHGVDRTAWPMIGEAAQRGYQTRIGFEDTVTLPDGAPAPSNAALVAAARRVYDD